MTEDWSLKTDDGCAEALDDPNEIRNTQDMLSLQAASQSGETRKRALAL